jgi:hypothetical protein
MMKWLLPATAAAIALVGGAATAQPYRDYGWHDERPAYGYGYSYGYRRDYDRRFYRDSDHDGIPDRAEWGQDRDHDGRPDQWDRYDNRRSRHHHRYERYSWRYDRAPDYRYDYGYRY